MLLLLISVVIHAEQRPNLVLLPVQVDEANQSLSSEFGNKIQGSLQAGYKVIFGAVVEQELEKIYQRISDRIDCDGAMCNREIAVEFNAEWIGYPSIKSLPGGYIASLAIRNVSTGETRFSESLPCRGCDAFDLLDKLPELGRLATVGHSVNSDESETTVKPASNVSGGSDEVDSSQQKKSVSNGALTDSGLAIFSITEVDPIHKEEEPISEGVITVDGKRKLFVGGGASFEIKPGLHRVELSQYGQFLGEFSFSTDARQHSADVRVVFQGSEMMKKVYKYPLKFEDESAPGQLVGYLKSKQSDTPLEGASITINGEQTIWSDENGYFRVDLQRGIYTLEIKRLGYRPRTLNVAIASGVRRDLYIPMIKQIDKKRSKLKDYNSISKQIFQT